MNQSNQVTAASSGPVISDQLHADLRLAWNLVQQAGHEAAADRIFEFLTVQGDKLRAAHVVSEQT
ncbi:hypothetical protein [Pseudoduganella sp. R-34]|uniref:hypothetical protein n=1 Tax=Pseudoduganella sp. R-34 TaxID=3404062 RepID=UPI003CF6698A